LSLLSFSRTPHPPPSTLFPYTTLFRSAPEVVPLADAAVDEEDVDGRAGAAQGFDLVVDEGTERRHLGGRVHVGDDEDLHRAPSRSEEHTSELQSRSDIVCRLLLEKKKV